MEAGWADGRGNLWRIPGAPTPEDGGGRSAVKGDGSTGAVLRLRCLTKEVNVEGSISVEGSARLKNS
jgi:hypothetical protein